MADSFEQWLKMATVSENEDKGDQAPHPPAPSPRSEEKGRWVGVVCLAPQSEKERYVGVVYLDPPEEQKGL